MPKKSVPPPDSEEHDYAFFDLDAEDTGAIFWSEAEGFVLKLPEVDDNGLLPIPLYLLGVIFTRFREDPDFPNELLTWTQRKPH